jgi:hypothetical protein
MTRPAAAVAREMVSGSSFGLIQLDHLETGALTTK